MKLQAWVDGELLPLERASISVLDQGFRTGEGVFETMRAYAGATFRLDRHLQRAAAGAVRLGFETPPLDQVTEAVEATVRANAHVADDLAVRLTLTAGPLDPHAPWPMSSLGQPSTIVTAHALVLSPGLYTDGIRAITVPWRRDVPDVKSVSYLAAMLARRQARAFGADEALMCDGDDHVVEGASSNVFVVEGGTVSTPPTSAGLLPGVTRAAVLEVAAAAGIRTVERSVGRLEMLDADEVFVTASTRELVPVVRVDDGLIGDGRPGELTQRLLAGYRRLVAEETGRTPGA